MWPQTLGYVRRALQFIGWGVLLCIFDLSFSRTTNGVGYRIDLLNDAAGLLLILIGVWRLGMVYVSATYRRLMLFVRLGAALALLAALDAHYLRPVAPATALFWSLADWLSGLGVIGFCLAMGLLWRSLGPPRLADYWRWAGIGYLLALALSLALRLALFWNSLFLREGAAPTLPLGGMASLASLLALASWILGLVAFVRSYWALRPQPAAAIIPPLIELGGGRRRWPLLAAAAGLALLVLGGYAVSLALRQAPPAREVGRVHVVSGWRAGSGASFSPDGTRILSQRDAPVYVYDAATGQELLSIVAAEWPTDYSYDPSGQRIATSRWKIELWDAATGQFLLACPPTFFGGDYIQFSPGGRFIASKGLSELHICDTSSGQEVRSFAYSLDGKSQHIFAFAYSPDGRFIALAYYDRIVMFDIALGRDVYVINTPDATILDLAWSPDGARLATIHADGVARIWERWGSRPIQEIGLVRRIDHLLGRYDSSSVSYSGVIAWSPDGTRLAIALEHGFAGVWDVATGAQRWRLLGHTKHVTRIEWRHDGQRLLTSGEEGNGLIWDVAEPAR
jgi:hypothetical protein